MTLKQNASSYITGQTGNALIKVAIISNKNKKMKKIIYSIILVFIMIETTNAQVALGGKQTIEGTSTILDFNNTDTNTNGIILPAVNSLPTILTDANNGTFLFDKTDNKVKMFENNAWINLTDAGSSSSIESNTSIESGNLQGVIIGSDSSNAEGILILESDDKAMILPRVEDPHLNVKSPYPGMMCYDTKSKSLAIFNGYLWNYWK